MPRAAGACSVAFLKPHGPDVCVIGNARRPTVSVGGFGLWLEDHNRCLARPQGSVSVQILVVVGLACPEATSFVPNSGPGADCAGSVDEVDGCVGMGLKVQPPPRLRVAPAIHRHRHKIRPFLEVAEDGNAVSARMSTHGS